MKCLKFGEILWLESDQIILFCSNCYTKYKKLEEFTIHLKNCSKVEHILKPKGKRIDFDAETRLLYKYKQGVCAYEIYGFNEQRNDTRNLENGRQQPDTVFKDLENELLNPRWYEEDDVTIDNQQQQFSENRNDKPSLRQVQSVRNPANSQAKTVTIRTLSAANKTNVTHENKRNDAESQKRILNTEINKNVSTVSISSSEKKQSEGKAKNIQTPPKSKAVNIQISPVKEEKMIISIGKNETKAKVVVEKSNTNKRKNSAGTAVSPEEPARKCVKIERSDSLNLRPKAVNATSITLTNSSTNRSQTTRQVNTSKNILNKTFVPPTKPITKVATVEHVKPKSPSKQTYFLKSSEPEINVDEYIIVTKDDKVMKRNSNAANINVKSLTVKQSNTSPSIAPKNKILNGQGITKTSPVQVNSSTKAIARSPTKQQNNPTPPKLLNKMNVNQKKNAVNVNIPIPPSIQQQIHPQQQQQKQQQKQQQQQKQPKIISDQKIISNALSAERLVIPMPSTTQQPQQQPVTQSPTQPSAQSNATAQILNKLQNLGLKIKKTGQTTNPEPVQQQGNALKNQATLALVQKLQSKGMKVSLVSGGKK